MFITTLAWCNYWSQCASSLLIWSLLTRGAYNVCSVDLKKSTIAKNSLFLFVSEPGRRWKRRRKKPCVWVLHKKSKVTWKNGVFLEEIIELPEDSEPTHKIFCNGSSCLGFAKYWQLEDALRISRLSLFGKLRKHCLKERDVKINSDKAWLGCGCRGGLHEKVFAQNTFNKDRGLTCGLLLKGLSEFRNHKPHQ